MALTRKATVGAIRQSQPKNAPYRDTSLPVHRVRTSAGTNLLLDALNRPIANQSEGSWAPVPSTRAREHRAWLVHVATGQRGAELQLTDMSYELVLNEGGSARLKVSPSSLDSIERQWLQPGWGGVLITAVKQVTGQVENDMGRPVLFGPIMSVEQDEPYGEVSIDVGDFTDILKANYLAHKLVANEMYWSQVIWHLCYKLATRPGGGLPIRDGAPHRTKEGVMGCGTTYEAKNVDKQSYWDIIEEIVNLPWGPDFMPSAGFTDSAGRDIHWRIRHGSTRHQSCSELPPLFLDARPGRGVGVKVGTTTVHMPSRVYVTGSGQGEGRDVVAVENGALGHAGFWWAEDVDGKSGNKPTTSQLVEAGTAKLNARQGNLHQLKLTVPRANLANTEWEVGQTMHVLVQGLAQIEDGILKGKIIKASSSLGSLEVELHMQETTQVDALYG